MIKYLILLSFFIVAYAKPIWVDDPTFGGKYDGAVGYSKKCKSIDIQERIAILQAKASLSHMIELTIEDTSEIVTDEFGDIDTSFSSEINSDTIMRTQEKDRYIDEEGSLYIWLIQIKGNL